MGTSQTVEIWRTSAGDTFSSIDLLLRPGISLRLMGPDLTRELRAGQQIKSLDTRRADIGLDLDGDGLADGADLAYWRVVVGFEEIELPASPRPVRALRLDDRVVVRTLSSRGSVIATSTQHNSIWYRAGVGVVRTVVWTDATASTATNDEKLLGYDGIDRGFGFTALSNVVGSGGQAVPFGSGYLSLNPSSERLVVANVRGERLGESRAHRVGEPNVLRQLLPTALGMRMAAVYNLADGSPTKFVLDAIDANGQLLPGPRAVQALEPRLQLSLEASGNAAKLASHPGSDVLWMVYHDGDTVARPDGSLAYHPKLVIHRYTADGLPLGPSLRLPATGFYISRGPQVLALADRALIISPEDSLRSDHRLVELTNDGRILLDRRYPLAPFSTGFPIVAQLHVTENARWLLWEGAGATSSEPLRRYAMRLAADGSPLDVPDSYEGALASALPWPSDLQTLSWPHVAFAARGSVFLTPASRVLTGGGLQTGIALFDAGTGDPRLQPAPRWVVLPTAQGSIPWITLADRTIFDRGYGAVFGDVVTTVYWHE